MVLELGTSLISTAPSLEPARLSCSKTLPESLYDPNEYLKVEWALFVESIEFYDKG